MRYVLCGAAGTVLGMFLMLVVIHLIRVRDSGRRRRGRTAERKHKRPSLKQVTNFLFVTTQIAALVWVTTSYGIAIYSTIVLKEVYTMGELSAPAVTTLLGALVMKVVGNIFEHNDGVIFGTSNKSDTTDDGDTGVG